MEPFLVVGLIALTVCFLKGNWRTGLEVIGAGLALVVLIALRGDASAGDVSALTHFTVLLGFPAWAALAIWSATRVPVSGSYWSRRLPPAEQAGSDQSSISDRGGDHPRNGQLSGPV